MTGLAEDADGERYCAHSNTVYIAVRTASFAYCIAASYIAIFKAHVAIAMLYSYMLRVTTPKLTTIQNAYIASMSCMTGHSEDFCVVIHSYIIDRMKGLNMIHWCNKLDLGLLPRPS